jgi:hypothetical protein
MTAMLRFDESNAAGTRGFWYLSTPHEAYVPTDAFFYAARLRACLIKRGIACFSPVVHCYPVSSLFDEQTPLAKLCQQDREAMLLDSNAIRREACGLLVGMLSSWEVSRAIVDDVEHFDREGLPMMTIGPDLIKAWFASDFPTPMNGVANWR